MLECTHPVMALQQDLFCLVPIAIFHCALKVGTMMAIEVLEYPILIFQTAKVGSLRWWSILDSG